MKIYKRLLWVLIVLSAFGLSGIVLAQISANYNLNWHVLSGGGDNRASSNYKVYDVLGQSVTDASSSASYRIQSGFLAGAMTGGGAPNLTISKSGPAFAAAGERITYTLNIANNGTAMASGLVVTDAIPSGAAYIQGGTRVGSVVSWTVASLASEANTSVQFAVTATQTITNSKYRVSASGGYYAAGSASVKTDVGANSPDGYEVDNTCGQARTIPTNGAIQTHNFHVPNEEDWVKFYANVHSTYVIQVDNVGDHVDALVLMYNLCNQPAFSSNDNAFGPTIRIEWNAPADGWYYLQIMQNEPSVAGAGTNYDLSVALDQTPPAAPTNVRASPGNQSLVVQWRKNTEYDVAGYRVWWGAYNGGPYGGSDDVNDPNATYYQITGLTNGTFYYVVLQARDTSGNWSSYSAQVAERPSASADPTFPVITLNRPSATAPYTTTVARLTVGGVCTDTGTNLSRIRVQNTTLGTENWNYGLAGSSMACLVESVPITYGTNQINVTVFDTYTNTASALTTINRVAGQHGAVVIVGGHNNSNSVQANINYASNRAYTIFRQSGYGVEDMMYLSPSALDADGDGVSDVISPTTPANVHAALQWATGRVGPGVPFYLYLMDHGEIENFCADGCDAGAISPTTLNTWLTELEATSGADQVNVIIEACHSGSFVDRFPGDPITSSISQNGRVVIVSTGRTNNAYASAQGAYFSDAFFSAVAESKSLLSAFNQAAMAVDATPFNQTPWLDDNGDGLSNPTDGAFAGNRYIANFFGGSLPEVKTITVTVASGVGTLSARVEQGNDSIDVVWAAVYAPSFQEPVTTTLYLGVPLIQLQPDLDHPGVYRTNYNGFGEQGTYKVVFYAADTAGNQALPKVKEAGGSKVYLPIVIRH